MEDSHQEEESMKQHQRRGEISCYYRLRKNPKKKTHKSFGLESPQDSLLSIKKILFRCKECGKAFRYEKCLSNHQLGIHSMMNRKRIYEESLTSLCNGFSIVTKKKRSRVIRYNKNRSCSFKGFNQLGFMSDQELEVAECLISLSKRSEKFVDGLRLVGEVIDSGFLRNEVISMEEKVKSDEMLKDSLSFVGDKSDLELQKLRKAGEFEFGSLSNDQKQLLSGEFQSGFFSNDQKTRIVDEFQSGVLSNEQKFRNSDEFQSVFLRNEQKLRTSAEFQRGLLSNEQKLRTSAEFQSGVLSNGQKLRNSDEFQSGFLSNEQKLRTSDEFQSGFLRNEQKLQTSGEFQSGFKNNEQKLFKSGEFESGFMSNEQNLLKSDESESGFLSNDQNLEEKSSKEDSNLRKGEDFNEKEMIKHKCKLCNKRFSSYQALGGHQTFHRMSKNKKKWKDDDDDDGGDDDDDDDDDNDDDVSVTVTVKKTKTHKCSICLRLFRSVHALGGHMKCHKTRREVVKDLGFIKCF